MPRLPRLWACTVRSADSSSDSPSMVDVTTTIVIARPIAVVSSFAANPDNAPLWYENIKAVEWRTARPLAVGSRVAFIAHFLGRRIAYTYEFSEYVPGSFLRMRTSEGP